MVGMSATLRMILDDMVAMGGDGFVLCERVVDVRCEILLRAWRLVFWCCWMADDAYFKYSNILGSAILNPTNVAK